MIAHIVLFRPRAELTVDDRRRFLHALRATCVGVSEVRRAMVGKTRGGFGDAPADYPFAAVIEFDDAVGLKAYLAHPAHGALRTLFWQSCEATVIIDVETVDARTGPLDDLIGESASD